MRSEGQPRTRRERVSSRLRLIHRKKPCRENRPQHQQEYYSHYPGSPHPGVQTRQLLQERGRKVIMEEENEEEKSKVETIHIQSNTCNCAECQEKRSKYVTILDVDRYIDSLNDWD